MPSSGTRPPIHRPKYRREEDTEHPGLLKIVAILVLPGLFSVVSQLSLSPSHGGTPSAISHGRVFWATVATNIPTYFFVPSGALPSIKTQSCMIPVLMSLLPIFHLYGVLASRVLGPVWGSAVIEAVALAPLLAMAMNVCWRSLFLTRANTLSHFPLPVAYAVPVAVTLFTENAVSSFLPYIVGLNALFTRTGLLLVTAAVTSIIFRSRLLWFAVVPFLHTLFLNPHSFAPSAAAIRDATLAKAGFALIARQESLTGYISVLDNQVEGYRVMRCDHSLLGGHWIHGVGRWPGGARFKGKPGPVPEPIYTVFVMLEAVRLVYGEVTNESPKPTLPLILDPKARALVIGLGIGTTPSALATHGINTTVVEIDPTVVSFARSHFALHPACNVVTADALSFIAQAISLSTPPKYSYIIHDVFTGGAEPALLFTLSFLQSLSTLLAGDGVIAINYASDLRLPSAALVFRTARAVFPSCRLFREDKPPEDSRAKSDFANTVLFCRKLPGRFEFMEPREQDFLESGAREMALRPEWEVDLEPFIAGEGILTEGNLGDLEKWGKEGAEGHWHVMRAVLPHEVWETW